MGIGIGGGGGGGSWPASSPPPIQSISPNPLPDAPAPPPMPPTYVPNVDDPDVQKARDEAKKRARAFQGYASTIKTSSQGVTGPALTTQTLG